MKPKLRLINDGIRNLAQRIAHRGPVRPGEIVRSSHRERLTEITRCPLSPLGPLDPEAPDTAKDMHRDLLGVKIGRQMDQSRIDRLIAKGIMVRRVGIAYEQDTFSMTEAGEEFYKTMQLPE